MVFQTAVATGMGNGSGLIVGPLCPRTDVAWSALVLSLTCRNPSTYDGSTAFWRGVAQLRRNGSVIFETRLLSMTEVTTSYTTTLVNGCPTVTIPLGGIRFSLGDTVDGLVIAEGSNIPFRASLLLVGEVG